MSSTYGNRSYKDALDNKTILITGGTDSFGHQVVEKILEVANPTEIIADATNAAGTGLI